MKEVPRPGIPESFGVGQRWGLSSLDIAGVMILTVSEGDQSQKKWLFPIQSHHGG